MTSWARCAWNDEWEAATDAGDKARADAAIEAVSTSSTWPGGMAAGSPAGAASLAEALADQLRAGTPLRLCR